MLYGSMAIREKQSVWEILPQRLGFVKKKQAAIAWLQMAKLNATRQRQKKSPFSHELKYG